MRLYSGSRPGARSSLALCLLLGVLAVSGCAKRPFQLPIVDPQSVPAQAREYGVMLNETEIVWRAYKRTDSREFMAYTYAYLSPSGQQNESHRIRARWFDEDGDMVGSYLGFGDPMADYSAIASLATDYDYIQQKPVYSLYAAGSAFDATAVTVVGVTSTGRRFEVEVLGGFWALHVGPAEQGENWASLTAIRANGSVVHRYEPRTLPAMALPEEDIDPLAELPVLSEDSIPKTIRLHARASADARGAVIVWRSCVQRGNYIYVAFTLDGPLTTGRGDLVVAAFDASIDCTCNMVASASGTLRSSYAFTPLSWGHGGGTRDGQRVGILKTGGMVLDDRVAKVIGITEQGRTVECVPFDKCWLLWCIYDIESPDPRAIEDRWVSIRAVDADGKVLHGLEKEQLPGFGGVRAP